MRRVIQVLWSVEWPVFLSGVFINESYGTIFYANVTECLSPRIPVLVFFFVRIWSIPNLREFWKKNLGIFETTRKAGGGGEGAFDRYYWDIAYVFRRIWIFIIRSKGNIEVFQPIFNNSNTEIKLSKIC